MSAGRHPPTAAAPARRDPPPPDSVVTPHELAAAFARPLPGLDAQKRMMVRPRPGGLEPPPGETTRESGVLLLLYPSDDGWCLPLILRSEDGGAHSGQVALPGGAREGTETLTETALREAEEELGVASRSVTVLGQLTPVYIPVSGFRITPTVGYVSRRPRFRADPVEVRQVLEVPLSLLLDRTLAGEEMRRFGTYRLHVPFYRVGEHKVWGATAMVLSEFAAVLCETARLRSQWIDARSD